MSSLSRLDARERNLFFERLKAANPHPETELEYTSPFELLVAVILSAQATDVSVNKVTRRLYPLANTPEMLIALGEPALQKALETIGLYRTKARNVLATCRLLIERHGSRVPRERAALEALPGVGRKTANVVLNTIFGEPTVAVDTHIFRVANRTGLAPGKDPLAVEHALTKVVPSAYLQDAHHWLILHGRYTCKARAPLCTRCVVADLCRFAPKSGAPGP
jgi:endonuclease-3